MYRFYVTKEQIRESEILIEGPDVDHIRKVLRMKIGEELIVCDGNGKDYQCVISSISFEEVRVGIDSVVETTTELQARIILFQGLPKKDKMELIIQKAVELGVYEIVPVITKRTIVKLDDRKKEQKKLERWQMIATAAAKQSNRGIIPLVKEPMRFVEAIDYAKTLDCSLIPYELAKGMKGTKEALQKACKAKSIGVLIGPEGGFEETEIEKASQADILPVTLGKRILRTETAGLTVLSILMYELELNDEE